ncbi:hypothetical protein PtA15_2A444 [Puccinia triticina]|uniref:Uncharacterized protein n=1 Tax=Puccinia triticina TaxID=208348 RepID=A0ABY7CE69_9BASI|nr:uncharacterized protein PtA15_2A444 [Puccinia triticina]WAQ82130.1 hypothetical protein PtA15_2A444 [Puccinia triticina]WAR52991.1 hypothetical protein PtB15_2B419 [Puccinia triticina]
MCAALTKERVTSRLLAEDRRIGQAGGSPGMDIDEHIGALGHLLYSEDAALADSQSEPDSSPTRRPASKPTAYGMPLARSQQELILVKSEADDQPVHRWFKCLRAAAPRWPPRISCQPEEDGQAAMPAEQSRFQPHQISQVGPDSKRSTNSSRSCQKMSRLSAQLAFELYQTGFKKFDKPLSKIQKRCIYYH